MSARSSLNLIMGLILERLSLCWNTAASFLSFMIFSGIFFVSGVLTYMYSLFSGPPGSDESRLMNRRN